MPENWGTVVEAVRSGQVKEKEIWSRLTDPERQDYLKASKQLGWDAAGLTPKDQGPTDAFAQGLAVTGAKGVAQGAGAIAKGAAKYGPGAVGAVEGFSQAHPMISSGLMLGASQLLPAGMLRNIAEMMAMMKGMSGGGAKPALSDQEQALASLPRNKSTALYTPGERPKVDLVDKVLGKPTQAVGAQLGDPPNLQRQGNLTNPGPFGPGSPSVGPAREINQGVPESAGSGYGFVDRRATDRGMGSEPFGMTDAQYEELRKRLGGTPGARQTPFSGFDEADKRKVMFGGAGDESRPQDRSPIGKATLRKPKK